MAKGTCSVEGCERTNWCRTWCTLHYDRFMRLGTTELPPRDGPNCTVDGCESDRKARGFCGTHYERWRKYGTTDLPSPKDTSEERFWAKVDVRGPDECWDWQGSLTAAGYGRVHAGGTTVLTHRFAYMLAKGIDPGDLFVCHHCDNRACCNAWGGHLFLGTAKDNHDDMVAKGRQLTGERCSWTKLTDHDVLAIRSLRAQGWTHQRIADEFGVSGAHVCSICSWNDRTHTPPEGRW